MGITFFLQSAIPEWRIGIGFKGGGQGSGGEAGREHHMMTGYKYGTQLPSVPLTLFCVYRCRRWMPSCKRRRMRRCRPGKLSALPYKPAEEAGAEERAGMRKSSRCSSKQSTCSLLEPMPGTLPGLLSTGHNVEVEICRTNGPKNTYNELASYM